MKRFFDTSVLVPVFYANHRHHGSSEAAFLSANKEDSFCALATLGEVYAVLTGMPLRPRISGSDAMDILHQIRGRVTVVSLTESEYLSALEEHAGGVIGGAIYDALIARCALKVDADVILTWNQRDFSRLGDNVSRRVRTPSE